MDNPFRGEWKLTHWLRLFKTPTKTAEPFTGKQAIGLLSIGIGAVSLALVMVIWVFLAFIAPKLPASAESLAQSEGAAQSTATALRNLLPGQEVRIERLFAYNLKLYIDSKPFEEIPYSDRKLTMSKIERLWCDNIGYHLLARVSIIDIRSGERLFTQGCAVSKLRSAFLR